jgi:hypothetical protein
MELGMSAAVVTSAVDIAGGEEMTLDKAVAAKLAAQRGNEDAAALWKKLWAAHEKAGVEGVEALLGQLLESPDAGEEREDA